MLAEAGERDWHERRDHQRCDRGTERDEPALRETLRIVPRQGYIIPVRLARVSAPIQENRTDAAS